MFYTDTLIPVSDGSSPSLSKPPSQSLYLFATSSSVSILSWHNNLSTIVINLLADSPRWLINRGRKEDAVKVLDLVRPAEDVRSGMSRLEADAIEEALHSDVMKAPRIDMIVS